MNWLKIGLCRKYGELNITNQPEDYVAFTSPNADNETDYVYDSFIKDYPSSGLRTSFGNVRVVLTEENATYTDKFLATIELVHRQIEEDNFDNIEDTDEDLPYGYPNNFNLLVNEILIALAASGAGVLHLNESQLIDIATGSGNYSQAVSDFMSSNFDTTDVNKPHAYLVWMMYDNNMNLIEQGSGVRRVTNPNSLEQLLRDEIPIAADGYLHAYVSNGSVPHVSFDNFMLTYLRGNTRQMESLLSLWIIDRWFRSF